MFISVGGIDFLRQLPTCRGRCRKKWEVSFASERILEIGEIEEVWIDQEKITVEQSE